MKALLIVLALLFHGGAFAADKWCVTDQWGGETQQCGDTKGAACLAVGGNLGNWGTIIGSIYVLDVDGCVVTGRYNDSGNLGEFFFTLRFVEDNQCQPNQSWLGGTGQVTKISGPEAETPTTSCYMGCLWNEGPTTPSMKGQDEEGNWWAWYDAPAKKSAGESCDDTFPNKSGTKPGTPKPVTCSKGFAPDSEGVCRKTSVDQTDPTTNTQDRQRSDGKFERVSTTSKTVCTATECTTTKTITTTTWPATVNGGPSGEPTESTETTVTTQPRAGSTRPGEAEADRDGQQDGTGDGSGYCEQNPQSPLCESSDTCQKDPTLLGCSKLTTPDEVQLPTRSFDIQAQTGPQFTGGSGCPADVQVSVFGTQVTAVPWASACNWITSYVRPVILLLAAISAVFIVLPRD